MTSSPASGRFRPRRALAAALAMVPFAVVLLGQLARPQPPAVMPTHWGVGGVDGVVTGTTFLGTALSVSGFCAILAALVSALWMVVPELVSRWVIAALGAVGAGFAAAYVLTLVGLDAAGGDPSAVSASWPAGAVVLGLVWGLVGYAVHGEVVPPREAVLDRIPERDRAVPLTGDGPVEWATTVSSSLLAGTAVFCAAVFGVVVAVVLAGGDPLVAVALLVLGLALTGYVYAWSRIRVEVDDHGLSIRSERLPVPLRQVPASEVVGVQSIDIDPMRWGGYGLRAVPGRTAYTVKGGPGIVVHRHTGHRLAIEVPAGEAQARAGADALRRAAGRALAAASR